MEEYPTKASYAGNNRNRKLKLELMEKYGVCYWCGVKVIDYVAQDGQRCPPNTATIDHLKSRFLRKKGEVVEKVLACNKCNGIRSKKEERIYGKRK